MKKLSLTLLVLVCVSSAPADDVSDIRAFYNEVKAGLDDEHGLYRTQIVVNTENAMYPAVGTFREEITFYWGSEGGFIWPILVVWMEQHAAWLDYGEVLFSTPVYEEDYGRERAVFHFMSTHDWDGNESEYRWYWSEGVLVHSTGRTVMPDGEVVEFTPGSPGESGYQKTPEELLDLFRAIHS